MLDSQLMHVDPFARAQEQAASANSAQAMPPMSGTMFDFKPAQQNVLPSNEPGLKSMLTPAKAGEKQDFDKSGLPALLSKLNIESKHLALNDIGRIQLIGRLKQRFGNDYQTNPEALEVLKRFDASTGKFKDETRKSTNALVSQGERTLAALLKG